MKVIAHSETLVGVLALICALAVLIGIVFEANAGLGPAASIDLQTVGSASTLKAHP